MTSKSIAAAALMLMVAHPSFAQPPRPNETPRAVTLVNSAPGKPTGSSTAARKIKVSWGAPSSTNGASAPRDYVIYYQLKGSSTWKKFTDAVSTSRSTTVTGLSAGKYYRFKVTPVNWFGSGTSSAVSGYIRSR